VNAPAPRDVLAARVRLAGHVRRTPLVRSAWLSAWTDADVWLKLESLQVTGAFKARGALNAVREIVEAEPDRAGGRTVVTASAGNHGHALAWAAREAGLRAVVFVPREAPATKLEAIRRLGADLRLVDGGYDEAERAALAFAGREPSSSSTPALQAGGHGIYVSPYNHPAVIAGGGTIGVEILEDLPDVDLVAVPVGGGGLVSGIATFLKAAAPQARVVGVEVEGNLVFRTALALGRVVHVPVGPTIADGLSGNLEPGSVTWEIVRARVDEMTWAAEREVRGAIRELAAHEHLVAEGAGAVAVAALLAGRIAAPGRRIVAVISGGNIDLETLRGALAPAP
jgi:threonine dehydratase